MEISVSDAKGQLTDLVRRAEAGDDVILTRHGQATVRLVPVRGGQDRPEQAARRRIMEAAGRAGRARATAGTTAAASQDFLYDEDGLPR